MSQLNTELGRCFQRNKLSLFGKRRDWHVLVKSSCGGPALSSASEETLGTVGRLVLQDPASNGQKTLPRMSMHSFQGVSVLLRDLQPWEEDTVCVHKGNGRHNTQNLVTCQQESSVISVAHDI